MSDISNELNFPPLSNKSGRSFEDYRKRYDESVSNPSSFWKEEAKNLTWFIPFLDTMDGSFEFGDINWFANGKLNACYNCLDRHIKERGNKTALIWESDEPGCGKTYTYRELTREVCKIANLMKSLGVRKGDVVTLYMPMIPELPMTMLACSRIGAVHSVVFAGFSAVSLRDRINSCSSRWLFTADCGLRGGKVTHLKLIADEAVSQCDSIEKIVVSRHVGSPVHMLAERDIWLQDELLLQKSYCPPEFMDSEDALFILYTSGSTGKPKALAHSTAGYLVHAALTMSWTFDFQDDDVFCCAADCGWITGHTYTTYGPLLLGGTTVIFESIPTYPDAYRYWDLVERHNITLFYTAPTAIRTLMRYESSGIRKYNLEKLRILGSVGEPINKDAWWWYYNEIGQGRCTVVDTYWQTETGGHLATNLPGVMNMKPGSCALPYFGIQFCVLDPLTGKEIETEEAVGVLCIKQSFPSIARTVYGDHDRYLSIYMKPYPGYYFTGDGCRRDKDGYYWITGRVDDVINPSGHRLGTAEIESALNSSSYVSESAVVGFPHTIKGEGIGCFVVLKHGVLESSELTMELKLTVRTAIGPIATPDFIIFGDLPKTRSGKIMRRILRKIAHGEADSIGDISTLADPSVVTRLITQFSAAI